MRTKLFNDYDAKTQSNKESIDGLKRDFEFLIKIKLQKLNEYVNDYTNRFIVRNSTEADDLKDKCKTKFNISEHDISRIDNLLKFFVTHFLPNGSAEDEKNDILIEDLLELKIINEVNKKNALQMLKSIKHNIDTIILPEYKKLKSLRSSSISIDSLTSKTSLKAILEDEAKYGEKKANYSPKCIGFVSVANFELRLNDDKKTITYFSCDKFDIGNLITTLENTLKEMNVAEEFANLD